MLEDDMNFSPYICQVLKFSSSRFIGEFTNTVRLFCLSESCLDYFTDFHPNIKLLPGNIKVTFLVTYLPVIQTA